MEKEFPIGTRVRMRGNVFNELRGAMCTIVPHDDIEISFPDSRSDNRKNVVRLDEVISGHLYWNAGDGTLEFVEGPEHPVRCMVNKRELEAYIGMMKKLIRRTKGSYENEEAWRCANAAVDKIAGMFPDAQRGISKGDM